MSHTIARIDDTGRLLVPVEALEAAGLAACREFAVDVDADNGSVTLTAVESSQDDDVDDDSWAYTPEHLERIRRARADAHAGSVYQLTESQLRELMTPERA